MKFTKGHGTRNDFVLVDDRDDTLDLTADLVRLLADRRSGVGGDGVIRLAPTAALAASGDPAAQAALRDNPEARWFMDYRNADGSIAEMCGNGVRVFAAYAESLGLADLSTPGASLPVATRAGVKNVSRDGDWYVVDMGAWFFPAGDNAAASGADATVQAAGWDAARPALSVNLGNPHTVVRVDSAADLAALDLSRQPAVTPTPPQGSNVEFIDFLDQPDDADGTDGHANGRADGHLRMRVFERGVGETPSCGTGCCAAALAARHWRLNTDGTAPDTYLVEIPGGTVRVRALASGHVELAGPAVLTYTGSIEI
ncbi:MAG: diaminopimelate epimerase [Cellulomonadaceae bacterium]|jgi:diaminopimelate epimerase|nr:diaminopimelate epimerase [Cellulomonadaceae bacterium]